MPWRRRAVPEERRGVYSGTDAEVVEFFRDYVERKRGIAPAIDMSTELYDLRLDSLDYVEIVQELEVRYDVDFPDDIPPMETIGDVAKYVKSVLEGESDVK